MARYQIHLAVLLGLGILTPAAFADSADTGAAAGDVETVIVTATKREEKLQDVPMGVTALSGEDLQRLQQTQLSDFVSQVPGMSLQQPSPGQNRIVLRGLNVGSPGATVATVIDDVPFSMSGAQANGAFFGADVDTYDLNRIEVLRGPQGTLYGATAEGGLVKYVTNAPNLNTPEASILLGGSTVDGGQTVGIAKGMFNLPFWGNKAALRVSAVTEGVPGYIDDQALGESNFNRGSKYSVRASLLVKPVDQFTARLTFFDQGLQMRNNNSAQVIGAAADPANPPANQFQRIGDFQNNTLFPHEIHYDLRDYALSLAYEFSAATLTSATSYGEIQNRFDNDLTDVNLAPGVPYGIYLGVFLPVYNQPIGVVERQKEYVHKFNQELRLQSNPGSTLFDHGFDWLVGFYYTDEKTILDQPIDARDLASPATVLQPALGGGSIPADYKEKSGFADFTYHFTQSFDLEAGLRYTRTDQTQATTTFCCVLYGPTDTTFPQLDTSENKTTYSVAPRFHITPDTMVYARYSTGYRAGGPNLPTPTLPNPPPLGPDNTRNYELGVKSDLFDHRFSFDVAVFDIDWTSVQILTLVSTSTGQVGINGNAGTARNKGVEWNFSWRPVSGLSLGLLGAYIDAKITEDAPLLGAMNGDKLPHVPDVTATANASYTWHAFSSYNAFLTGAWSYVGQQYTDFSISRAIEQHAKLPSYDVLRVSTGVDNGRFSLEFYGENLANSRGKTEYSNSGGVNQTGLATFIQPRTIGVQLGAKF